MSFNYAKEIKKFIREWKVEYKRCKQAGMPLEDIKMMYEYDWKDFKKRRSYEKRLIDVEDEAIEKITGTYTSVFDLTSSECANKFSWIEEIENEKLLLKIKQLSYDDLELLRLIAIEDKTQATTALIKGISQKNVSKKMSRIKKFFK